MAAETDETASGNNDCSSIDGLERLELSVSGHFECKTHMPFYEFCNKLNGVRKDIEERGGSHPSVVCMSGAICLSGLRKETDEEMLERANRIKRTKQAEIQRKLEQYRQLKAEFEPQS